MEMVEREVKIMKKLHHYNLVQLYGVCEADDILIVTELMPGGSLLKHLKSEKPLNSILLYFAFQVVKIIIFF